MGEGFSINFGGWGDGANGSKVDWGVYNQHGAVYFGHYLIGYFGGTVIRNSTALAPEFSGLTGAATGIKWASRGSKLEYDSKGNIISREAKNLTDQYAMENAKSGLGEKLDLKMTDPRYDGMHKMEYKFDANNGNQSVVHYVRDPVSGKTMDFKFHKHSANNQPFSLP